MSTGYRPAQGASGRIALMKKNSAGGKNHQCEWLDVQPSSARMDAIQEPQHAVLFFVIDLSLQLTEEADAPRIQTHKKRQIRHI